MSFNTPHDISYRGLKPLSIYKELRHIRLRRTVDLPPVVHRGIEDQPLPFKLRPDREQRAEQAPGCTKQPTF